MNTIFPSKSLTGIFMVIFYSKKPIKTDNGVCSIYNIFGVMPSLLYLQMRGLSIMREPMDDFDTTDGIPEVCYVLPCGVDLM